jgi:hypothetical protein
VRLTPNVKLRALPAPTHSSYITSSCQLPLSDTICPTASTNRYAEPFVDVLRVHAARYPARCMIRRWNAQFYSIGAFASPFMYLPQAQSALSTRRGFRPSNAR